MCFACVCIWSQHDQGASSHNDSLTPSMQRILYMWKMSPGQLWKKETFKKCFTNFFTKFISFGEFLRSRCLVRRRAERLFTKQYSPSKNIEKQQKSIKSIKSPSLSKLSQLSKVSFRFRWRKNNERSPQNQRSWDAQCRGCLRHRLAPKRQKRSAAAAFCSKKEKKRTKRKEKEKKSVLFCFFFKNVFYKATARGLCVNASEMFCKKKHHWMWLLFTERAVRVWLKNPTACAYRWFHVPTNSKEKSSVAPSGCKCLWCRCCNKPRPFERRGEVWSTWSVFVCDAVRRRAKWENRVYHLCNWKALSWRPKSDETPKGKRLQEKRQNETILSSIFGKRCSTFASQHWMAQTRRTSCFLSTTVCLPQAFARQGLKWQFLQNNNGNFGKIIVLHDSKCIVLKAEYRTDRAIQKRSC